MKTFFAVFFAILAAAVIIFIGLSAKARLDQWERAKQTCYVQINGEVDAMKLRSSQDHEDTLALAQRAQDSSDVLTSGFGQVIIPGMLIVSGNAAATAANILAHGPLFRFSILAALLGVACHIVWTYLFYELFKPVNRNLSLLAVCFSLVGIALQAVSSAIQAAPLFLQGGPAFAAFNAQQVETLVFVFLRFNGRVFETYLVFFGFWCVLTGYLIFKSTFMPRILGLLEALAGLCWLTFIWPPLAHYVSPYNQIVAGLGEISLMLWLLVMGVNAERWKEQASAAAEWGLEKGR